MKSIRAVAATLVLGVFGASLGLTAGAQPPGELSGPISSTLVGDVTCTVVGAPCIRIADSGVSVRL